MPKIKPAFLSFPILLAACNGSDPNGELPDPTVEPERVSVEAGDVTLGFARGRIREKAHLEPFEISKYPITHAEYQACLDAGVCSEPNEEACAPEADRLLEGLDVEADDSPALCVGHEQAARFCEWQGGELPNLAQWMVAARGPKPQRYPWGDERPDCYRHPLDRNIKAPRTLRSMDLDPHTGATTRSCPESTQAKSLSLGAAPDTASSASLAAVLLAPSELLRPSTLDAFSACGKRFDACVVYGSEAGAIDSISPLYHFDRTLDSGETEVSTNVTHPYGFRCAFSGE